MTNTYIDKSLTTLNALNDNGELFYKKPMSKEEAVAMLRKYAQEFPLRYDEEIGYIHGNSGLVDLCHVCQLDYGDVAINSVKIPYHIEDSESLSDVQAAVREIILEECDAIMATDNHYALFLHACVLHSVFDAYLCYANKVIKGVRDGKVNGLQIQKIGRTKKVLRNTINADYPDMIQIVDASCLNKPKPVLDD